MSNGRSRLGGLTRYARVQFMKLCQNVNDMAGVRGSRCSVCAAANLRAMRNARRWLHYCHGLEIIERTSRSGASLSRADPVRDVSSRVEPPEERCGRFRKAGVRLGPTWGAMMLPPVPGRGARCSGARPNRRVTGFHVRIAAALQDRQIAPPVGLVPFRRQSRGHLCCVAFRTPATSWRAGQSCSI